MSVFKGGGLLSFDAESEDWQMENGEPEKSPEEMRDDLRQLEDEINTLKQVLHVKVSLEVYLVLAEVNVMILIEGKESERHTTEVGHHPNAIDQ